MSNWPSSLTRRRPDSSASIWAPRFDPFSNEDWPRSDTLFPPKKEPVAEQDSSGSPEQISMMLRNLGITPSPKPPASNSSPSNSPPALSPTTQILSLGSNSTIHTPTPTRAVEPLLPVDPPSFSLTPIAKPLFSPDIPTKPRAEDPHSRRSTGSNTTQPRMNLAPRHGGPQPINSHERVMSWMQRQNLSQSPVVPNAAFMPAPARSDWLPGSSMGLPAWDRPVMRAPMAASMWAPQVQRPVPTAFTPVTVPERRPEPALNEPINFLRLLQPSSQPQYDLLVMRIVKNSDQQSSIFLQQKLKAATTEDARRPIFDAIVDQGFEMMTNRFGNWAIQRCLEAPCSPKERKRVADVMEGRVIELATNCYGTHVVQKALDCAESVQMMVVSEMLQGDLATTLMNKHASHVWTKIMELSWSEPAPPIFDYVNKAMKGRWANLARHETGSLIVQHAFENLVDSDKSDCVREVLDSVAELATDQWGSWVVQHLLENGTETDRTQAVDALVENIPTLAINPQGIKVIEKALKAGGAMAVDKVVRRLSQPAEGGRRPLIVDLAVGAIGSQLVGLVLPMLTKAQLSILHDSVRGHTVTLKGTKSGSRVVWLLFDRPKTLHH